MITAANEHTIDMYDVKNVHLYIIGFLLFVIFSGCQSYGESYVICLGKFFLLRKSDFTGFRVPKKSNISYIMERKSNKWIYSRIYLSCLYTRSGFISLRILYNEYAHVHENTLVHAICGIRALFSIDHLMSQRPKWFQVFCY